MRLRIFRSPRDGVVAGQLVGRLLDLLDQVDDPRMVDLAVAIERWFVRSFETAASVFESTGSTGSLSATREVLAGKGLPVGVGGAPLPGADAAAITQLYLARWQAGQPSPLALGWPKAHKNSNLPWFKQLLMSFL